MDQAQPIPDLRSIQYVKIAGFKVHEIIYKSKNTLVYRGRDKAEKKPVIIKTLVSTQPSILNIARLKHEAEILKGLDLSGIPEFIDVVQYQNTPCLIMEDIGGVSLSELFEFKCLSLDIFFKMSIQIMEILREIHRKHIIHKDINPTNIIWNIETNQAQIIDFGVSSLLSREISHFRSPDRLEGTLAYISPEQTGRMNQDIDYRTDFYSLGLTFYELF